MEWRGKEDAVFPKANPIQFARMVLRIVTMAIGTIILVPLFFILRLLEFFTPPIQWSRIAKYLWARLGLYLSGIKLEVRGKHMRHGGAVVANHVSWLDIFVLLASANISFVSKSEVRNWPVIGFLAYVTGTMFIERRATQSKRQHDELLERLKQGDQLCFFPEATSTDGRRVLEFKSTLFSVFHTPDLVKHVWVQPATMSFISPKGHEDEFYGWWGDMEVAPSVFAVLALSSRGKVRVTLHDPVRAEDFESRKDLARHCGGIIRQQLADDLGMTLSEVSKR